VYRCGFNNSVDLILGFLPTFIAYERHALKINETGVKHTHIRTHTHYIYIIIGYKIQTTKFGKLPSIVTYEGKVSF
jgi:hypothetical protein